MIEFNNSSKDLIYWEKTKDITDQLIDIILNYRQSGHPGGSRSKVHILLSLMLSGLMRWDIRNPVNRYSDRFILSAGHTVPLVYCVLAVLNEALRIKYQHTKNSIYKLRYDEADALYWEDLIGFRRKNGLSGHAEMVNKTLFLKFNTGPSGHGFPAAAGESLALKRAGLDETKVFLLEGEAGLTPGAVHETLNTAWGLNLNNLILLLDWNDYGIDDHRVSDVVFGGPKDWIGSHGWNVLGTEDGIKWKSILKVFQEYEQTIAKQKKPTAIYFKTRKGRGYLKFDNYSHGSPHSMNSKVFWDTKKGFAEKYNVDFINYYGDAPGNEDSIKREFHSNLESVIRVLTGDQELVDYLADRLVKIGGSVPLASKNFILTDGKKSPFSDPKIYDFRNYPKDLFVNPGIKAANRSALRKWGAWINAFGAENYNRPIFIASSADLAGSTNIVGFAERYNNFKGYGWYGLSENLDGALLPQEITEFANAGLMVGLVSTNLAEAPKQDFEGFWGACSTYGAFSYLKYGMFRLFSQMEQNSPIKLGKVLWIVGHSGPETADDSRTHFGIFSPGVTQLFPMGHIVNLHPWEHNEVPVMLGAALELNVPIIALHLTRPNIEIPDREEMNIPSYFEAAKGAYIIRDYDENEKKIGAIIVQGTSAVSNTLSILEEIENARWNIKIICATSAELFKKQEEEYKESVLSSFDRKNSIVITTQAKSLMKDWIFNTEFKEYFLSADWDNNWRTGGTLKEVLDEAHLSPKWIFNGINKYVNSRKK